MHSKYDARETTSAARAAFQGKFERDVDPEGVLAPDERDVDPEGVLAPDERARRAKSARKAHYLSMAYKSARARSRNRSPEAA